VQVSPSSPSINLKAFVLCTCTDLVARKFFQGLKAHSAFESCGNCLLHGKHVAGAVRFPGKQGTFKLRSRNDYTKLALEVSDYHMNDV
jgi:hypothetical protein